MSHYDANLGPTYTYTYMFRFCGTDTFPLISDLSIIFSLLRRPIIYCVILLSIASFYYLLRRSIIYCVFCFSLFSNSIYIFD